jgi:LacI family transcriptional regulator
MRIAGDPRKGSPRWSDRFSPVTRQRETIVGYQGQTESRLTRAPDILAIGDPEVAAALRLIRQRAAGGLTVAEVLREVPLSRSLLERRMRQAIGRTPKAEILRLQLDRVRGLLAETTLSLDQIAQRTGYKHTQNMVELFKKKFGQTPGAYRRSVRG